MGIGEESMWTISQRVLLRRILGPGLGGEMGLRNGERGQTLDLFRTTQWVTFC